MPSSSGSTSLLGLLGPECEVTLVQRFVGNHSPKDSVTTQKTCCENLKFRVGSSACLFTFSATFRELRVSSTCISTQFFSRHYEFCCLVFFVFIVNDCPSCLLSSGDSSPKHLPVSLFLLSRKSFFTASNTEKHYFQESYCQFCSDSCSLIMLLLRAALPYQIYFRQVT